MSLPQSLPRTDTPSRLRVPLQTLVIALLVFVIALGAMGLAVTWLDFTLGLILAAPVCTLACALPLAGRVTGVRSELAMALVIAIGATLPVGLAAIHFTGYASAMLQLICLCIAIALIAIELPRLAMRIGAHPALSAALLLIIAMAWMTLPVWMSRSFSEPWGVWVIDHLLAYQPLIALNGAFASLGDWSHQPLAYTYLTSLGQDVPFALPTSAWRCVLLHGAIGLLALFIRL